ncbi:MAG: hypothetical protein RIR87_1598, partial [Actinomycetota bacterium]
RTDFPPKSASAFPGKRLDAKRAGMTTRYDPDGVALTEEQTMIAEEFDIRIW